MGTGLFIIDAIIIAIVILPFVLFIYGSKKKARKLRAALQAEASLNNCKLSKTETQGNLAIGIDSNEQKLFFYKEMTDVAHATVIDLKSITSCELVKETRRIKDSKKHYNVIDRVLLNFTYPNTNDISSLELYNNNDEASLSGEINFAQKWQDYINEHFIANTAQAISRGHSEINIVLN